MLSTIAEVFSRTRQPTEIQEIKIAVFGQRGAGKTTLLASYYGNQQRHSFEEKHGYKLEMDDTSQRNMLLSKYYNMENGQFPLGTEDVANFKFNFKVGGLRESALKVSWCDYPGGWWEMTPTDEGEQAARNDALADLVTSHVGLFIIDGERYLKDGAPYVRSVLDQFKNEISRVIDSLVEEGAAVTIYPEDWIIAISKSDLLPADETAESVAKFIVTQAADQLSGVSKVINSKNFGSLFLLLSAVDGNKSQVVDVNSFIGLQLIAPVALMAPLYRLAEESRPRGGDAVPVKVLEVLSHVVDLFLANSAILPPKFRGILGVLKAMAVQDKIERSAAYFRELQEKAVKKGKAVEATVQAMKAELVSADAQKAYYRQPR